MTELAEVNVRSPEIATSFLTTDGGQENRFAQVGLTGRIVGANIELGGAAQRGGLLVRVVVFRIPQLADLPKWELLHDYAYSEYRPSGYGSLPVEAGDVIMIRSHNRTSSQSIRLRLLMTAEDSGPIIWNRTVDPGTHGNIRTVTGANPAAGAEASDAVPQNVQQELLAYGIALVTDATVANRQPILVIDGGTTTNRRYLDVSDNQAASLTVTHLWYPGSRLPDSASGLTVTDTQTVRIQPSLPGWLGPLATGYRLRTITVNLQAGDDHAAPIFQVEERFRP